MSRTDVQDVNESVTSMNPVMAPTAGLILYLGAVVLNLAADTGEPAEQNLTDWVVTLAIAGVGVAIAIWASRRAITRGAESMARTALVLGVFAVLTMVAFWAGLPCVFGATALGLGWAARPTGGRPSTPGIVGMLLGALALISGAITMVVG
jgi:hypothetical protein